MKININSDGDQGKILDIKNAIIFIGTVFSNN